MRSPFLIGLLLIAAVMLSSCRGTGFDAMDYQSFWTTEAKEDKEREKDWDKYYGRKKLSYESEAWKDFYDVPGEQVPRYEHCGFWGGVQQNCRGMNAPNPTPNCDFYGNCADKKQSLGW